MAVYNMSLHILLCLLCPITGHNEIYRHSIIIDSHGLWQYIDVYHIFSFICYVLLRVITKHIDTRLLSIAMDFGNILTFITYSPLFVMSY